MKQIYDFEPEPTKFTVYTFIHGLPGFQAAGPDTESARLNWRELLQLLKDLKLNLAIRFDHPWIVLDSDYHMGRAQGNLPY